MLQTNNVVSILDLSGNHIGRQGAECLVDMLEENMTIAELVCCKSCVTFSRICSLIFTFNPLPDDKISDWPKLERIADDILKCI